MINSEAKPGPSKRLWLPLFVFGVGILITMAVTYFVAQNRLLKAQQDFRTEVLQLQAQIQNRIEAYIALLRGGGALFSVDNWVDPAEFEMFVRRLRMTEFYQGAQGLGVAFRINDETQAELLPRFEAFYPGFSIWPNEGQVEAFPVTLIEPMDERNRAVIGFDMFSEPVRREAMMRARDSGLPAASGKVTLAQEITGPKQPGFLIYLPVYSSGELPKSVELRRKNVRGFIYSPFRAHDFLHIIVERENSSGLDFEVYDGTDISSDNLLFESSPGLAGSDDTGRFETVSAIDIAGRQWTIRFRSEADPRLSRWTLPIILFAGLVLTSLLSYLTYAEARARSLAEQVNIDLQRSQSALRASEELHRTVMQTASDGIIVSDAHGIIRSANSAAEMIFGYEPGALTGRPFVEIIPERLRGRHQIEVGRYLETGERPAEWLGLQMPGLSKSGEEIPLEISYGKFTREKQTFITGIIRDISARKKAEEALRTSQLQLQTIADALPVLIGAVDQDLRYRFNNRTYERWFGHRPEELSGKSMKEVLGEEAFQDLQPYLERGLSGKEAIFESGISYPEQGIRYVHGTIIPDFDKQQKVVGLFLLMMDISDRKRQETRAGFLVKAGQALSSSLDYRETLGKMAHFAVPDVADWCVVDLLDEQNQLQRLTAVHSNPEKSALARDMGKRFGPMPESEALRKVTREGLVLFEPRLTDDFLKGVARSEDHLEILRSAGMQSLIAVPIQGRRSIYGIIIFLTAESRRIYTRDDVHMAEELAFQVGLAVENAMVLQESQREIEERRVVERAFRESEERFRIMVEQARDYAIFMIDPAGRISSWNSGAERILGYTGDEILGQHGKILFTPEDQRNGADKIEMQTAKEKGRATDERWHMRKDGSRFFCSGYMFALRNEDGGLRGFTKIMRDITERKRWEEDIQRLNQELESRVEQRTSDLRESYEQMETFTYTVAHDLRAPLRSMLGFSQAIMEENEGCLDETSQDYLQRIMRASKRMDALIQDLLAYSHLARTDLKFEPVPLQDVINDILTLLADDIEGKKITMIAHGPFPEVYAHRATLHAILTNLVSNAIKFTSSIASPRVELRAETRSKENHAMVRCWVIDNGIGISAEHHDRIFRVFERLHGPERYAGTGIGLAIVKKGVERMNGHVGLESKRNEGSRFWIELPAV